jgi:pimeloyl-ACP methyl ester carboxylesterase
MTLAGSSGSTSAGAAGHSPFPPHSIETCLVDLESIRNFYEIDRWIIGGHSWGADLALIYASEYTPHVVSLICIAGGRIHNDREWHNEYEGTCTDIQDAQVVAYFLHIRVRKPEKATTSAGTRGEQGVAS